MPSGVRDGWITAIAGMPSSFKRFVAIVDRGDQGDLKSMSPVWCFFGGEGGAAVLGLMPSPEPVTIGEHRYLGLLVPSAPVPFGGALIYVPVDWVKPAEGGVERLLNVYVSMGVTPPIGAGARAVISRRARSSAATGKPRTAPKRRRASRFSLSANVAKRKCSTSPSLTT